MKIIVRAIAARAVAPQGGAARSAQGTPQKETLKSNTKAGAPEPQVLWLETQGPRWAPASSLSASARKLDASCPRRYVP